MKICPITYLPVADNYSARGLRLLGLKTLQDFPYSQNQQLLEASSRADKLSIQGVQPKLSAVISKAAAGFQLVDQGSTYILKPQHNIYPELPQNEDLTMRLASACGIETPVHGMIYSADNSLTYFIKRFDRHQGQKLHVEDFAQLSGKNRQTKYDSSMETIATIIDQYFTFPALEKIKLFRLTLFSYLVGNEDMHLKNFSLIIQNDKITLSPAYDLLNTTIAMGNVKEELALPLAGKKRNVTNKLLIDYFAIEYLKISKKQLENILNDFIKAKEKWDELLANNFLSGNLKEKYKKLVATRWQNVFGTATATSTFYN